MTCSLHLHKCFTSTLNDFHQGEQRWKTKAAKLKVPSGHALSGDLDGFIVIYVVYSDLFCDLFSDFHSDCILICSGL